MRTIGLTFALAALFLSLLLPCEQAFPLPDSPRTQTACVASVDSSDAVVFAFFRVPGESKPNIFAMGAAPVEVLFRLRT